MSDIQQKNTSANVSNGPALEESGLNIKLIIGKFLSFLPYFILSAGISLGIAFLINRYSNPRYLVKATMLVKEKNNRGGMDGADGFLQGMQLLNTSKNIENELGIIRSRKMVQETINNLDFGITYYSKGNIKKTDLYGNVPFSIVLDSNHLQCMGGEISLTFIGANKVQVSAEKPLQIFVPKTGEVIGHEVILSKQEFDMREEIVSEHYKFRIQINQPQSVSSQDLIYSFKLNTQEGLINQYTNKYTAKPINKQSSIIEISIEGNWPEKDIAFLNKLCATYINRGLEEKNKTTSNTIAFIDAQLGNISDSLNSAENQLQLYRSTNKIIDLSSTGENIIEQVGDLEKNKAEEELKGKYYQYLLNYVQANTGFDEVVAPSAMGIQDPLLNGILAKMIETYAKKKTLEISLKESNPMIQEANNALIVLKQTLQENLKNIMAAHKLVLKDLNGRIAVFEA